MPSIRTALKSVFLFAFLNACCACTGGADKGTGERLLKTIAGEPADFSCNGSWTGPLSVGSAINTSFTVFAREPTATPPSPDTRIDVFDVATSTTTGAFTVTGETGDALLPATSPGALEDSRRYSFRLSRPPDDGSYVNTYFLGAVTPPLSLADSNHPVELQIVKDSTYLVSLGFLGFTPSDVPGTSQLAGTIGDCDGNVVQNATISVLGGSEEAGLCGDSNPEFPCIAYFRARGPNPDATFVDETGIFSVVGVPPGVDYTIEATGIIESGAPPETVGRIVLRTRVDDACPVPGATTCSVYLFSSSPLPGWNSLEP